MKRRILSSLMALVLVFGLLPATAFAAEGETTDPFASAKTIYVSDKGTGNGETTDAPTTLPEAVAKINGYTPAPSEAAPTFIISLTGDLDFECENGELTLKKYATRILGNGHTIKTYQTITATGEGIRVDLGTPNDRKNTLTVDVKGDRPTLTINMGAEMHMYDGVTVNHTLITPEEDPDGKLRGKYGSGAHSDAAITVQAKSNFYMHGGRVSDCTALKAIILVDGESHVEIHGGKVRDNIIMGTNFGGAICLFNKSSLVVDGNVVFKNNKTENRGGAIYLVGNSTANISGKTVFENNKAGSIGGAIYVQYSSLTVDGATFEGNSASLGGAILTLGGSGPNKATVQLEDCMFTGNSTTGGGAGGALYLQDTEMTLTDCIIENNTADGGVFVTASDENLSKLTLNGTNLIQNNTITDGTPCNLYLEVAGDSDTSDKQLTLNVGDSFNRSRIGVTMHTVKRDTPKESVPFTVDYQKNCVDTHPSSYFFSDNPGYRVDWSKDGKEARLLKGTAEYKVVLDPTSLDFGSKVVEYATAPEAKTVTVTNKGNMPVTVTLPKIDGYILAWDDGTQSPTKTLPIGGSAVFTVQPKTGLPAGSYDKTAKLTVDNGIPLELSVLFSVTAPSSGGDDDDKYFFAIQKVDAQDGHALNDAKFELYQRDSRDNKLPASRKTTAHWGTESGIALFSVSATQTRDGGSTWYYREITAPEGYVLDTKEYEISAGDFYHDDQSKAVAKAKTVRNYRGTTPDLLNDSDHFAYVIGYMDGNVRPYGLISRAETTTIFFRLLKDSVRDGNLLTSNTYTDVADDYWANTAISTMTGLGIVQGRSTTTFDPKAPITRAQFAAICARFDTGKSNGEQTFSDIQGHWAEKYIQRAAELGWIKGFEDGTFRPDTYITRAQAMTMINRVLNRIPEEESDLLPGMNVWPDCNPGDWFYLAVQEATNSHDFEHKAGNYETWTKLMKNPDWTRYEH